MTIGVINLVQDPVGQKKNAPSTSANKSSKQSLRRAFSCCNPRSHRCVVGIAIACSTCITQRSFLLIRNVSLLRVIWVKLKGIGTEVRLPLCFSHSLSGQDRMAGGGQMRILLEGDSSSTSKNGKGITLTSKDFLVIKDGRGVNQDLFLGVGDSAQLPCFSKESHFCKTGEKQTFPCLTPPPPTHRVHSRAAQPEKWKFLHSLHSALCCCCCTV